MKRYLRRLFVGGTVVIMILNMLVCSLVFISIIKGNVRTSLQTVINSFFLLDTPQVENCQGIAGQLYGTDNGLEIAFLQEDGTLVAAMPGEARIGSSRASDEDVKQALQEEWGEGVRRSDVTGVYTMYLTRRIGDGLMLSLGYPLTSITTFLLAILGASVLLCLIVLLTLHLATDRICSRLLKPLRQINDLLHANHAALAAKQSSDVFEEVQPLMDNISALIRKLHYDLEEIQRTQQMRRDFVANASHELKSPMTSIRGFAELLQAGMGGDEAQQMEYLGRIVRESNRMLAIIEDILQLNRAESNQPENVTEVDMRAVCDEAIQALESIAAKKNIKLSVAGHGKVMANSQEMWELVYNLVDNGIRYGRENGFVSVRVDRQGLTIIDNGIGMEKDQLRRIFERFYRVDNSHTKSPDGMPGGTGLGLSIVKHIALKYGGDVSVVSEPGEGSTFIVYLGPVGGAD